MVTDKNLSFKTDRQKKEFPRVNTQLQTITFFVAGYMKAKCNHQAVITSVLRTAAEQRALLKKGATTLTQSPHMEGRAIDIRLNDFKGNVKELVDEINKIFPRKDKYKTALAHGVGANFHLHLQVPSIGDKK